MTLAAGGSAYSDPVPFQVVAFTRYAISLDVSTAPGISRVVLGRGSADYGDVRRNVNAARSVDYDPQLKAMES